MSCLKVDRAFVRDLGRDEDSAAITLKIVNLPCGIKLQAVAEGVETEGQLAVLREMACDEYQDFLFSKPVDADEVPALLVRAGWHTFARSIRFTAVPAGLMATGRPGAPAHISFAALKITAGAILRAGIA